MGLTRFKPLEHLMDGTDAQHGFTGIDTPLIIYAVAARATQPGKRAFHDPPFWQQHKALAFCRSADNVQAPRARGRGLDPPLKIVIVIFVIRPDYCQRICQNWLLELRPTPGRRRPPSLYAGAKRLCNSATRCRKCARRSASDTPSPIHRRGRKKWRTSSTTRQNRCAATKSWKPRVGE